MLEEPTDLADALYGAAKSMLRERVDLSGRGVRLLGLTATHLAYSSDAEQSLFPDTDTERKERAAVAIDKLRGRFGDGAVTFGRLLEKRADNTGTPTSKPVDP